LRSLYLGSVGWAQLVNVLYLVLLGLAGLLVAERRIGKLLLR
jgi:lipooligosaccharide transport system permease protein